MDVRDRLRRVTASLQLRNVRLKRRGSEGGQLIRSKPGLQVLLEDVLMVHLCSTRCHFAL